MAGGDRGTFLRQAAGIFSANALNNLAALGITLAAGRVMPLGDFGALGLSLALIVLIATLADWGLSLSLVRTINRTPAIGPAAAAFLQAWKLVLLLVLVTLALVVPPSWLELAPSLDRTTLAATLLSAGLLGCWMTRRALEQARENFSALRRATAACALLRVLAFTFVVLVDAVTPLAVLACLYVLPLSALLAAQARDTLAPTRAQLLAAGRVLLTYGGWAGASALCFVAFTRAPLLVLASAGDPADVGVFTGALTCAFGFAMLGEALRTVALPRIVRATSLAQRDAVRLWLRHQTAPVLALATGALLGIVLCYEQLLGQAHLGGALLLLVMGVATLAAAGLGLQNALVHAQARPRLEAAVNAARILAFTGVLSLLPGTPLAVAISYALVLVTGELALYGLVRLPDRAASRDRPTDDHVPELPSTTALARP